MFCAWLFEVGMKLCSNGVIRFHFSTGEYLMMRNWWKFFCGLSAVAIVAMAATTALAGDLGLIVNGDMETDKPVQSPRNSRVDHPNGYPDAWHHSQNSAWSGAIGGPMSVSPTHSLYIPDTTPAAMVMRKCAALRRPSRRGNRRKAGFELEVEVGHHQHGRRLVQRHRPDIQRPRHRF